MNEVDRAVASIRQLIDERGLSEAIQLIPRLAHLVPAPTDSVLEAMEREIERSVFYDQ